MDQRQHLRAEIDRAASGIVTKFNELEERAVEIKEEVQASLSLETQVERRPWTVLGVGIGAGFLVGMLLPERRK